MEKENRKQLKAILFCAPHLSTGGLPQYLTKKVELLKGSYEIYVVEYEDVTGGVLVVQKNILRNLIGDKLITIPWGGNKQILIDTIARVNPDIVHLEEMPEYFMDADIARQIYTSDRKYKIFETSHDSSFDCAKKRFLPDKFILVSDFQIDMLESLGIPSEVVEYPIEYKKRGERSEALKKLGLDPNFKHILHVGLFTQRKNQKEFFEYAREFEGENVIFHSVGNMADNFQDYWKPLLENKPSNVICHGEKSNVSDYYEAMDLFLFTSRGTVNDKETMPLVIKEAISWDIPTLIYNLPVYKNYFDNFDKVNYLDFEDFNANINIISDTLYLDFQSKAVEKEIVSETLGKTCIIISTYTANENISNITLEAIKSVKQFGYDIILTSHINVPTELQNEVNHVIYDSNNILTRHDFYNQAWNENSEFYMRINLTGENNNIYHGPAVYTNYYNGISYAKTLGYDNAICFNYDIFITDIKVINTLIDKLKTKSAIFNHTVAQEGNALRTVLFAVKTEFFVNNFKRVDTESDYDMWKTSIGSESNGLENMFYHNLKPVLNKIDLISDEEFYGLLSECKIDICSMVEYFTVIPMKGNKNQFVVWYSTSNTIDSRNIKIEVFKDGESFIIENFKTLTAHLFYKVIDFTDDGNFIITLTEDDTLLRSIKVNKKYMETQLNDNGEFRLKTLSEPKIRIIHLVTEPLTNRKEMDSINSIQDFSGKYQNIEYYQLVNEIYKDLPPVDNCFRPQDITLEPGGNNLTPAHYGCYLAHKNGLMLDGNENFDIIIIFEGDAYIDSDHNTLYNNIIRWSKIGKENSIDIIGFGNIAAQFHDKKIEDLAINPSMFAPAHSYFVNKESLDVVKKTLNHTKWDVFDLWVTYVSHLTTAIADDFYARQLEGYSLIDKTVKTKNNGIREIYY